MNLEEFKIKWCPNELSRWTEFDEKELAKSPLKEETKLFLKNGFPEDAAPFLNFGWRSYEMKFYNIHDYYLKFDTKLANETKNYWILGCDGAGNAICFDTSNEDCLVLLDHETGFQLIDRINMSIQELAHCLLIYKEFVAQIQAELGDEAWIESKYTLAHINNLQEQFLAINPKIFNQSSFWDSSVNGLLRELAHIEKMKTKALLQKERKTELMSSPTIVYLLPWERTEESDSLERELKKEMNQEHPLFGKKVKAMAMRIDCDDVLFKVEEDKYAVVHLTWRQSRETSPNYPRTRIFNNWTEVYEKVVVQDNREYEEE